MGKQQTIGARIVKCRANLGWSQIDLSAASGVAPAQISRYESGGNPRPTVVAKLAKALGVSFDWLLSGEDEPQGGGAPQRSETISLQLPDDLRDYLMERAKQEGTSFEDLVNRLLMESFNREQARDPSGSEDKT